MAGEVEPVEVSTNILKLELIRQKIKTYIEKVYCFVLIVFCKITNDDILRQIIEFSLLSPTLKQVQLQWINDTLVLIVCKKRAFITSLLIDILDLSYNSLLIGSILIQYDILGPDPGFWIRTEDRSRVWVVVRLSSPKLGTYSLDLGCPSVCLSLLYGMG